MSCLQPGEVHRASDTHDCLACFGRKAETPIGAGDPVAQFQMVFLALHDAATADQARRSEEHTSELQSLMRISYAVFCLKKNKIKQIVSDIHANSKTHATNRNNTY